MIHHSGTEMTGDWLYWDKEERGDEEIDKEDNEIGQ